MPPAYGVKPNSGLAADSGLKIGVTGGIKVDEFMQTDDSSIYAIGDFANLQGRAAGENAVSGNKASFRGTIGTSICKISLRGYEAARILMAAG